MEDDVIEKMLPVWLFLLTLLLGALGAVFFGWAVKHQLQGGERLGKIGEAAVSVANFPSLTADVITQILETDSGEVFDKNFGAPRMSVDLNDYGPFPSLASEELPGLVFKATDDIEPGWRILYGSFAIRGSIKNALVVISPDLEILGFLPVNEIPVGDKIPKRDRNKFAHGFEIFSDGSFIFAFDNGVSLQKFDSCGMRVWTIPRGFHHSVTAVEDQSAVWTHDDENFALVSVGDGSILQEFSTEDLIAANPNIDILEIRRVHDNGLGKNTRNSNGKWLEESLHYNDVDPLPRSLAGMYEDFDEGDLLVSARSLNLIYIVDPNTLTIKWWRVGASQRQHDPDWTRDGRLSIYNNRMSRDYSEILYLDPKSFEVEVSMDGREYDFYSRIRGKHQWLGGGNLLISSPQQGRLIEIDTTGSLALEIFNLNPDSTDRNLTISEIKWFPLDYFKPQIWKCDQ